MQKDREDKAIIGPGQQVNNQDLLQVHMDNGSIKHKRPALVSTLTLCTIILATLNTLRTRIITFTPRDQGSFECFSSESTLGKIPKRRRTTGGLQAYSQKG